MLGQVLEGVGHEQVAIDVLNAKGRKTGWEIRVSEITADLGIGCWPEAALTIGSEDIDRTASEISSKQEHTVDIGTEDQTL